MGVIKVGRRSCLLLREWRGSLMVALLWQTGMSAPRAFFVALLCLSAISGCGGVKKGPETVEVTGTVTLGGNPVEGASVVFYPGLGTDDQRLASQATTDQGGRFKLSTSV